MKIHEIFPQKQNLLLLSSDFPFLEDGEISIEKKEACLILFHDNSDESHHVLDSWKEVFSKVLCLEHYTCNLSNEEAIKNTLCKLCNSHNLLYMEICRHRVPFILFYENGQVKDVYRSVLDSKHLLEYSLHVVNESHSNDH